MGKFEKELKFYNLGVKDQGLHCLLMEYNIFESTLVELAIHVFVLCTITKVYLCYNS